MDPASPLPTGAGRMLLAAEADSATACVVTGQLQSRLDDDWLQHDTLTATVAAATVPTSWGPHALCRLTEALVPPSGSPTTLPFGRYRLSGGAGATVRQAGPQRTVQAEDWLRAKLLRPWHEGLSDGLLNPPLAAAALLFAYTGQLRSDPFGTGVDISSADFVTAGTAAFGSQVSGTLLINWTGVAPVAGDLLRLTPVGSTAAPPDPIYEASAIAEAAGPPDLSGTYILRLATDAIPLSLNGSNTLQLRYWQDGTGYIGPTLLISVNAQTANLSAHTATSGGITLTTAGATVTGPLWGTTWEAAIFAVLWMLTGSTAATPWVTADGELAALSVQNGLAIPANVNAPGPVTLDALGPLALLSYERTTSWLAFLGELCRGVQPGGGGKTNWGMRPLTLTYDADGVLHLRRAAERWGDGLGWSTDPAHAAPQPLRLGPPLQDTPGVPAYDRLQLYAPGQSSTAAGVTTTVPPRLITERVISTDWAVYDPDWERVSEITLASTGLEGVFFAATPFALEGWVVTYAGGLLDELATRLLGAARPASLTLAQPGRYPRLTQLVSLCHLPQEMAGHYRLESVTTPLQGALGTWQLAWWAPWTVA